MTFFRCGYANPNGVICAFALTLDLLGGIVADTTAGVDLVTKLMGVKILTFSSSQSMTELSE